LNNKQINNYINLNKKILEKYITYIFNKNNTNFIKIFGPEFVKNNKNNCKMIIDNIEYEIKEQFYVGNCENNTLKIKLKGINNECELLSSLPNKS